MRTRTRARRCRTRTVLSIVASTGKVASPQLISRSNSADRACEKLNHMPRSLCRRLSPKRQAPSTRNRVPSPPPKLSDQLTSVPAPDSPSSRTFVSDSRMYEPSVAVKVSLSRFGAPDIASISMPCSSAEAPVASKVRRSAGRQRRIWPRPTARGEIFRRTHGVCPDRYFVCKGLQWSDAIAKGIWRPNPYRPCEIRGQLPCPTAAFDTVGRATGCHSLA